MMLENIPSLGLLPGLSGDRPSCASSTMVQGGPTICQTLYHAVITTGIQLDRQVCTCMRSPRRRLAWS